MALPKVVKAQADLENRTTALFFDDGSSGIFYIKGGITWPIHWDRGDVDDFSGFVLIGAQSIKTKIVWILEQASFVSIKNVIEDGKILFEGVHQFFNMAWGRYFLSDYYYNHPDEVHKKNLLEVLREDFIKPKPHFIKMSWDPKQEQYGAIQEFVKLRKLRIPRDSELARQMLVTPYERSKRKKIYPSVHALQALLYGITRIPFRKKPTDSMIW